MAFRFMFAVLTAFSMQCIAAALTPAQIVEALGKPENSTGNVTDAVETATGDRGWMNTDTKSLYDSRIVGRTATALMRPARTNDEHVYPPHHLRILGEAASGSVLVHVRHDGLEIAAIGNLMAATTKIRDLEGAVIDGAVRDISGIRDMRFPVYARRVSPATSVGHMVSIGEQVPVKRGGVLVPPEDYIVGDPDGVVVVPQGAAEKVVEWLAQYDDK